MRAINGYVAILALSACGDADKATEVTADVEVTEVEVTEVEVEAETSIACAPGTGVEVVADGPVRLEHCGATLTGSAPSGTTVALNVVEAPAPFPYEHDLVGPAFEVSGTGFSGALAIADDGEPPGYRMAAQFLDGWQGFEACPGEAGTSFGVSTGIFALFRDVNTYPDSPRDVGSGTVTSNFMGESITWGFDDGYAIHEAGLDGLRFVTVVVRRAPAADVLQQLDVRLSERADHTFQLLQVTLLDTSDLSGGWSWLEPVDGPTSTGTVAAEGDRIVGAIEAPLRKGDATESMAITLDVTSGRYRYPPEGACLSE